MIHGAIQHISAVGGLYLSERGSGRVEEGRGRGRGWRWRWRWRGGPGIKEAPDKRGADAAC